MNTKKNSCNKSNTEKKETNLKDTSKDTKDTKDKIQFNNTVWLTGC